MSVPTWPNRLAKTLGASSGRRPNVAAEIVARTRIARAGLDRFRPGSSSGASSRRSQYAATTLNSAPATMTNVTIGCFAPVVYSQTLATNAPTV